MCDEKIIYRAAFPLTDIDTDTINGVNGISFTPLSVDDFITANPGQFWKETDLNGTVALCSVKIAWQPLIVSAIHDSIPYDVSARNFVLIGGHPPKPPGK